ncbi:hypothetical protein [Nostoc sp.]|uniref:hypothetical protein n=1 Tax=Nostoc sp. TaxID=1180 RepID=UPI002FF9423E
MAYDIKYVTLQSFLKDARANGNVLNCKLDAEYNVLKSEYERLTSSQPSSNKIENLNNLSNDILPDSQVTTIKGEFPDTDSNWRMIEVKKTRDNLYAQSLCPVLCTSFYDSKLNITKYFPFRGIFKLTGNKWLLTGETCDVSWLEAVQSNIKHRYRQNYTVALQSEYGVRGATQWRINEIYNTNVCIMAGLTCITPGMNNHAGDTTVQPLVQLIVTDNNKPKAFHNFQPSTQLASTK